MNLMARIKKFIYSSYKRSKQSLDKLLKIIFATEDNTDVPSIKNITLFGIAVLFGFILIFGGWAIFASVDSAAVTKGKVVIASNRKTIQHLEGGIIKKIFVHDGSIVKSGDPLIQLDDTQSKAALMLLQNQANHLLAEQARLIAERDQTLTVSFPPELLKNKNDIEVQKILNTQLALFETNKKSLAGQLEILQYKIQELKKQIQSLNAQIDSSNKQLAIIQKELNALEILDKKRLIDKPRLWALQREAARIAGNKDELIGNIAQAQQKIGEAQQQMLTLKDDTQKEILLKLTETQNKLTDILERKVAVEDQLKRTTIIAPYSGTIVGLKEHTIGGVITAGKPILDLVPSNEQLIVEAKVNPLDIDSIHAGLTARIQLIAYKSRNIPWVNGTVSDVSADIFEDKETSQSYYIARVIVPLQEIRQLQGVRLYPGMPVDVMIIIEKRSPWSYFISPIKESFFRAFREQ